MLQAYQSVYNFLDDLANPVAVKELRQAVQGRFVLSIMLLFLLISVGAIGLAAMNADEAMSGMSSGQPAFLFFMVLLMSTCLVLIPVYVGVRMAMERRPEEMDIMYATTLRPGSFIQGKLICGLMLSVLIYSMCLPFMTLTYLLRGVDLPTIFGLLTLGLIVCMAANQITVFVACLPVARWLKGLLGLGVLSFLVWGVAVIVMISEETLRQGIPWRAGWYNFWFPLTLFLFGLAATGGLLYVLCVVIVTPNTANRALVARAYMTVVTLLTAVGLAYWAWKEKIYEPMFALVIIFSSILCIAFMVGVSERQVIGPRIRRNIPRHPLLRVLAFLFYSGAGGGILWSVLLLTFVLGVGYAVPGFGKRTNMYLEFQEMRHFFLILSLYVVGYGLSGLYIQRTFLRHWIRPHLVWGISALLMILFCVLPMIIAFFLKVEFINDRQAPWFFGNPFALIYYQGRAAMFGTIGICYAVLALIANLLWLVGQYKQFQPLENVDTESIE